LLVFLVGGDQIPLGSDAKEGFSFPKVPSLRREGFRLLGPALEFVGSHGSLYRLKNKKFPAEARARSAFPYTGSTWRGGRGAAGEAVNPARAETRL
jgi:hypothetical protein